MTQLRTVRPNLRALTQAEESNQCAVDSSRKVKHVFSLLRCLWNSLHNSVLSTNHLIRLSSRIWNVRLSHVERQSHGMLLFLSSI